MARLALVTTIIVAVLRLLSGDAFLTGGPPRPTTKGVSKINEVGGNSRTTVDEVSTGPSPAIETISIGSSNLLVDSELTALQARAIALEAATSKTVPKDTALEALHCLARSSEIELSKESSAPLPLESMDGVWRLCFCEGGSGFPLLDGVVVDKHGYLHEGQDVDMLLDAKKENIVLGSAGLETATLPSTAAPFMTVPTGGLLEYTPETQTITGTFDQESAGVEQVVLRACLVDDDALGFHTVSEDASRDGFLLFHAERSKAARAKLLPQASPSPLPSSSSSPLPSVDSSSKDAEAQKAAATAKVAGEKLLELKLGMELMGAENIHEDKRLAVQEAGRKTGSFNTFIRYLETEGATIYAVLAGPILFSFMKHYTPVAGTKATAAAVVMVETVKHVLKA